MYDPRSVGARDNRVAPMNGPGSPALEAWRREVRRGLRAPDRTDWLYLAAAAEATALELQDVAPALAALFLEDAALAWDLYLRLGVEQLLASLPEPGAT